MGNIYEHIKMCTYTDTHREKGCSFIELAVNLAATTRKKKCSFKIPKISSCGNCREHYVVVKFPAKHHIAEALIFSGFISL